MRDQIDRALKEQLVIQILTADPGGKELAEHLRQCQVCREELGEYFLLDRWLEGDLPPVAAPAGFTGLVMDRLAQTSEASRRLIPARTQARLRHGRQLLWSYLAAAAVTLVMIFTNSFGTFLNLANQPDRWNGEARAISKQTQRLVQTAPSWRIVWTRLWPGAEPASRNNEGRENHGQE